MFLCRTRRLSAAALDQVFRSAGPFPVQVKANRLKDVTLTLRKDRTLQAHRCFCASVDSTPVHPGRQPADPPRPVQIWDSSSGFVITDWGHLNRVTSIAVNISRRVQSDAGKLGFVKPPFVHTKRHYSSGGEPVGYVLFTSKRRVSSRHCFTSTMQTRAASTKKSDAGEEKTTDSYKAEHQNLNEASTTSSSTAMASGEAELEGQKPNKTQQLKKVFKEYGAVGVSFHICISLMSLGMFYLLLSSGIDMAAVLCKLGFSETVVQSKFAAGTSTFVLAYAIHKLFAPVRISITLVSVPLIVRYFRKTGLFKPPTPAP